MTEGKITKFVVASVVAFVVFFGFISVFVTIGNDYGATLDARVTNIENNATYALTSGEGVVYTVSSSQEEAGLDSQSTDAAQLGDAYSTVRQPFSIMGVIREIGDFFISELGVHPYIVGALIGVVGILILLGFAAYIRGFTP